METVKIGEIIQAAKVHQDDMHNDILEIQLTLNSNYMATKAENTIVHTVLILTEKDTGIQSVAIDEFPSMDEKSIEEFRESTYEEARKKRKILLQELVKESAPDLNLLNSLYPEMDISLLQSLSDSSL